MYTWTRIIQFKNMTSMMAAMPICVSIVEYMRKELSQEASLLTPSLGGHPARALFVVKGPDMAKNLIAMDMAAQDPRYRDLVSKLGEHVDGSATNDQTWKTVV
jgi:predicted urease superfamily metal-dependent hydrolase